MLSAARGGAPSRPPSIPPEGPGSIEPATTEIPRVIARPPAEPTLVSAQQAPPPPPPPPPEEQEEEKEEEPTLEGPAAVDLKLADVPGLSDLPDEERQKLQSSAKIHPLAQGEEIGGFALALVIRGDVDVAAQIVDVPADRIGQGTVLRGRGTIPDGVPLRLMCASANALVATWQAAEIDPALETCPWVADDLRAQADRVQALVGVTLGPLADRLDSELRRMVTSRLQLRELSEGEVIVEQGNQVKQLLIVGQGHVELSKDGDPQGSVGAGELLFPAEILSNGKAPATARAGKGGALVLQADRLVAQELMVTCPPLLEIFGGM
jgi:signal-transduction protein with cAMP-binding, CBS, and nucleotidyltransferase domain